MQPVHCELPQLPIKEQTSGIPSSQATKFRHLDPGFLRRDQVGTCWLVHQHLVLARVAGLQVPAVETASGFMQLVRSGIQR